MLLIFNLTALSSNEEVNSWSLEQLAWLTGYWQSRDGVNEELWLKPKGNIMLGLHRDVKGEKTSFEYLRIEQLEEGVFYAASPGGGKITRFKLKSLTKNKAVFENPQHDFPQRIIYQLQSAKSVLVTIETIEGKNPIRWQWQKTNF